jgi:hypothetical protein
MISKQFFWHHWSVVPEPKRPMYNFCSGGGGSTS